MIIPVLLCAGRVPFCICICGIYQLTETYAEWIFHDVILLSDDIHAKSIADK